MNTKLNFTGRIKLTCGLLLACTGCFAQSYPSFSVDVCDTGSKGYYFILPFAPAGVMDPVHMILDNKGRVVYYKTIVGQRSDDFKIQPNGLMSYNMGTKFYLMDSSFTVVDSVACVNGIQTDGHELQILPNGHFLLLGFENVLMDLSSYHIFGINHTLAGSATASVKCGVIQELDANHNLVFEWHTKDHFAFGDVDPLFMTSPVNVDWTHCNALDLDTDGNILLSSRHLDEVTKISRIDSSIIWRLGGNANQFTFTNDPAMFVGQHDCRRIANGNLTINDDGRANPLHPASAKEYELDENLLTATLAWSYMESPSSYSTSLGDVCRLPNGNTLVDNGFTPLENFMFNVVDTSGTKIFQVTFLDTLRSYRAFNYFTLPWQLNRPQISCYTVGPQLYLDAGSGHSSYLWSNGATTQTIPVSAADTFSVFVPIGTGGFISSDYLVITDPATYCLSSGIESATVNSDFSIFPDPVTSQLQIHFQENPNEKLKIEIYEASGKKVISTEAFSTGNRLELSVPDLPSGIYFLRINGEGKKFLKL